MDPHERRRDRDALLSEEEIARDQSWFDHARLLKEIVAKLEVASLQTFELEQSDKPGEPISSATPMSAAPRRSPRRGAQLSAWRDQHDSGTSARCRARDHRQTAWSLVRRRHFWSAAPFTFSPSKGALSASITR